MAEEERGGVQNVWLLFIALGLGLLVVVIYNVHIYNVRREGRGRLVGLLPMGSSLKTFRIMEGVRVLAIGGEGIQPSRGVDDPAPSRRAARSYRSITVEVSKDVSLEFANVLTHVSGSPWVELISSRDRSDRNFGRINPLLKDLAKQPSRPPASVDDWD